MTTLSEWKKGEKSGNDDNVHQVGDGLHGEVWSAQREYERSGENKDSERVIALPFSAHRRKWLLRIGWTLLDAKCALLTHQFAKYTSVSDRFSLKFRFGVNLES